LKGGKGFAGRPVSVPGFNLRGKKAMSGARGKNGAGRAIRIPCRIQRSGPHHIPLAQDMSALWSMAEGGVKA